MLLALLYGVLTGASLAPAPVAAQPTTISAQSERAILSTAGKNRAAALKAQRSSPDLGFLPATPVEQRSLGLRATAQNAAPRHGLAAATAASPYRARAPPAA
ncbi:hypothetical protein [Sphingomonas astaxanthinifaciens]|nr:hypothetical protein [Sphingomonas astaxanthinifaciens]